MKRIKKFFKTEKIINTVILFLIFCFLLSYFKPSLMLLETTTSGGDTASHYYPAKFMKEYLLPKGKLTGWCPGAYGGFPLFHFYFPLTFFMMVVLSYFIPLQIAFKLITVLGTFLLPVTAFFAMRLMKFKFPVPIIAAILTLPFLFNTGNSMWGGNIPSTLAGEFSYSLSLALTVLFFGLLYKGIESKKLFLHNSLLFAGIAFTHVYTMIFVAFSSLFFLIEKSRKRFVSNFIYMFKVYSLGFLLIAFWFLPFVLKLDFTTPYNFTWVFSDARKEIFPDILLPFYLFSLFGFYKSLKIKDKRILLIFFSLLISILFYFFAPMIGVVDIRFLPFLQLFLLLIASYGLGELTKKVKSKWIIPMIVLFLTLIWVKNHSDYIQYWIEWNYSGFESKSLWPEYSAVNNFLAGSYKDPRVVYEHSMLHDAAGTPRAFESLPLFSGRSTLEGLYMQSSISAPFVFYIQSEISKVTSCPFPQWHCTHFNSTKAANHLEIFNVKHVIARTDEVKSSLESNPDYELIADFDPYQIYELKTNKDRYVIVPDYEPVLFETEDWKRTSYEWFKREDLLDIPLVFSEDVKEIRLVSEDLDNIPKVPLDSDCVIDEDISVEEIKIKTSCVGKPHIVRVSYFPNWQVEGADSIYLVSPSFMLIFPNQENVRLYYGQTLVDKIGILCSYIGVLMILLIIFSRSQKVKRLFSL